MDFSTKIRFKWLKLCKKLRDIKVAVTKKVNDFLNRNGKEVKARIISVAACMVGTTAICLHNVTAAVSAQGKTISLRKLSIIAVVGGALFAYVWWNMPGSKRPLTEEDVDDIIDIVKMSGHAPSEHIQPVLDFAHAAVFQGGPYNSIDWEIREKEDTEDTGYRAYGNSTGYGNYASNPFLNSDDEDEDAFIGRPPISSQVRPLNMPSVRIKTVQEKEEELKRKRRLPGHGMVVGELIGSANTSDRLADYHRDSVGHASDLPDTWIRGKG